MTKIAFNRPPDPLDTLLNRLEAGIDALEVRVGAVTLEALELKFDIEFTNRDYLNGDDLSLTPEDDSAAA